MSTTLATGARRPYTVAFDDLAKARFGGLDTGALLVYLIDLVSADALPYLAEQFNVQGFKGYVVADTDQERRDLISRAIELNKAAGSVYGIRVGLELLGFTDVVIAEYMAQTYNGFWTYDGLNTHGTTNWANFIVLFNPPSGDVLDAGDQVLIDGFIDAYKNVRSNFLGIWYVVLYGDPTQILSGWAGRPQIGGGMIISAYNSGASIIGEDVEHITVNGVTYDFNTVTIQGA